MFSFSKRCKNIFKSSNETNKESLKNIDENEMKSDLLIDCTRINDVYENVEQFQEKDLLNQGLNFSFSNINEQSNEYFKHFSSDMSQQPAPMTYDVFSVWPNTSENDLQLVQSEQDIVKNVEEIQGSDLMYSFANFNFSQVEEWNVDKFFYLFFNGKDVVCE